jgi:hypothetical protein
MLHFMQREIANPSSQAAYNFAGLLTALASVKPTELPRWNDDDNPKDVATLSYENALRKHARYKSGDAEEITTTQPPASRSARIGAAIKNEMPLRQAATLAPKGERDRKCASVTIRMSHSECEQLRERAAEAGLTISAYLRSCTFEADSLRAQVKQTLAELRSTHAPEASQAKDRTKQNENHEAGESERNSESEGSRLGWLRRIILDLHPARSLVRA